MGAELPGFALHVRVLDDDVLHQVRQVLPEALLAAVLLERRFVHHAGDAHVAAQRNPADAVFCAFVFVRSVFLLLGRSLAHELAPPVAVGAEEAEFPVEEEVELLHSYLKNLCCKEVSALMQDDEQGEGDDELQSFDENCVHSVYIL